MYINGRTVSGPLDSFTEVLIPKHVIDLDKVRVIRTKCYQNKLAPLEIYGIGT